jgi:hypothetical protein
MRVWPVAAYDCADTAASTCILCAGGCGRNLCPHCDAQNQAYDDALQARIAVELAERDAAEAALDKPTKQSAGVRCAPGGESTAWGALSLGVSAGALLLPLLPPPR